MGQVEPMLEQTAARTGERPPEHLVDGGFAKLESITTAAKEGGTVYTPVSAPRDKDVDPHKAKPGDTPEVAAWRERMGTPEAKEIYKERCATAETVNADIRTWRGLDRFQVRGVEKALSVALWAAITYNVMRGIASGAWTC